ncbi:hypothetical protein DSBG_2599 [Desulfosporosinus sp. BG]|nr:hypothetical protein DSBG_2599 [Desulfosporosinus sp. BG]
MRILVENKSIFLENEGYIIENGSLLLSSLSSIIILDYDTIQLLFL